MFHIYNWIYIPYAVFVCFRLGFHILVHDLIVYFYGERLSLNIYYYFIMLYQLQIPANNLLSIITLLRTKYPLEMLESSDLQRERVDVSLIIFISICYNYFGFVNAECGFFLKGQSSIDLVKY